MRDSQTIGNTHVGKKRKSYGEATTCCPSRGQSFHTKQLLKNVNCYLFTYDDSVCRCKKSQNCQR